MNAILHHMLRTVCLSALAAGLAVMPAASLAQAQSDQPAQAADADEAGEDTGIFALEAEEDPPLFDNADAAVDVFKKALAADDFDGLAKLLGLDAAKLRKAEGVMDTYAKIREGAAKKLVVVDIDNGKILQIGEKLWPFPFPLLKGEDGKWAFDSEAGLEEIVNRRVGENELEAIATMRAYVEAQQDYAEADHDGDGVEEFAQKLISSEGATDGLYWPADAEHGESPAGDLNPAELEDASRGEGYFGYRFKILTGQGEDIAGGAYDYVVNDNMIGGCALLAWPAKYAETGVHTFAVNQQGIVYEADLGPATDQIVKYIDRFNPGEDWTVVKD
ncbi:DUF2950 domain-containing protein [Mesorhizobium sp. LHD-90]|uniref:DUF2950 domain-containing protein n=1 Tax=Mesorhizobium sp. LHD-90 TaxID=3071414 RepID=UPI0027DF88E5|nr:DUF2950 domain-containing protein [Mesorhizobium sp. LHD-90]MDQ6437557.1 DUF2950 domain-containing protein [Mesorhizobium sp. LHD-90]